MLGFTELCFGLMSVFHLTLARCVNNDRNVFLQETSADSFLSRSLLYNKWDFELVTPGNIERECIEEICSYEEAREVFEDDQQTAAFWKTYTHSHEPDSTFSPLETFSRSGPSRNQRDHRRTFECTRGSSSQLDVAGLVAGILGAVVFAIIVLVLGCYCYKRKSKTVRRGGSVPVRMAADGRPAPETVPLANIAAPGLPSYNEALNHSGQHDAPPPPYTGVEPSEPTAPQLEE